MAIENFISVKETDGPKLSWRSRARKELRGGPDEPAACGLAQGRRADRGHARQRRGAQDKSVILATGALARDECAGRARISRPRRSLPALRRSAVQGQGCGGDRWRQLGVEAAIDLAGIVGHVTLLEFDSKLRADAVLQAKLGSLPNVTVITDAQTTEVTGNGEKMNGLVLKDRNSGEVHRVALAGVFVQIGLLPNTDWLKGTVALSKHGEIEINDRCETSLPGVFGG